MTRFLGWYFGWKLLCPVWVLFSVSGVIVPLLSVSGGVSFLIIINNYFPLNQIYGGVVRDKSNNSYKQYLPGLNSIFCNDSF